MDSLYAHACRYFEDRFMTVGLPRVPEALDPISFEIRGPAFSMVDPITASHLLDNAWERVTHGFALRGLSVYRPAWAISHEGGQLFVMATRVQEPARVAAAIKAMAADEAPEDVHPFADRVPPGGVTAARVWPEKGKLVPSVAEEMREAINAQPDPEPLLHRLTSSAAWPAIRDAAVDVLREAEASRDPQLVGRVMWDQNIITADLITAAMTEGGEPGPLRDLGGGRDAALIAEYFDKHIAGLKEAAAIQAWGDLSDGELLQAMGTDAAKWAEAFLVITSRSPGIVERHDAMALTGWFANAIEAGREAGRTQLHCHPAEGYQKKRPEGFPTYYDITEDVFRPVTSEWADAVLHRERTQARTIRDVRKALEHLDLNVQHFQVREGPAPDAAG